MYLFCNSRIHVITLYSDHVCVYYASMLRCCHLVQFLVRTNHPCLGVGCHIAPPPFHSPLSAMKPPPLPLRRPSPLWPTLVSSPCRWRQPHALGILLSRHCRWVAPSTVRAAGTPPSRGFPLGWATAHPPLPCAVLSEPLPSRHQPPHALPSLSSVAPTPPLCLHTALSPWYVPAPTTMPGASATHYRCPPSGPHHALPPKPPAAAMPPPSPTHLEWWPPGGGAWHYQALWAALVVLASGLGRLGKALG
jgi:hypothetical protein